MAAIDAWQRFLSGQQTNLTRRQIAAYQGAMEQQKLVNTYRMHREKLAASEDELAAKLGFRREQLAYAVDRWTKDRAVRVKLYNAMTAKWGQDNARQIWQTLTQVALGRERLQQAEEAGRRRDWIGVQKALGYLEDEEGNMTPTLAREQADALNTYRDASLGARRDALNSLNTYREARLGQQDRWYNLRAGQAAAKEQRAVDRIRGRLNLSYSEIESGTLDDWLADKNSLEDIVNAPGMPMDITPEEQMALLARRRKMGQQRPQQPVSVPVSAPPQPRVPAAPLPRPVPTPQTATPYVYAPPPPPTRPRSTPETSTPYVWKPKQPKFKVAP